MKTIGQTFCLVFLLVAASASQAYTELGNGLGGVYNTAAPNHQPWFLSPNRRVVEVCVNNFPSDVISRQTFSEILKNAFKYWSQNSRLAPEILRMLPDSAVVRFDCMGSEDLTINIVDNFRKASIADSESNEPDFEAALSSRVAEAIPIHDVPTLPWTQGKINIGGPNHKIFIYTDLNPFQMFRLDWNSTDKISSVVYHEIGHVMGMGHTSDGGLMDVDFVQRYLFNIRRDRGR